MTETDDLIDALINVDPEPCQTCDTGIVYIHCWDHKARCRNCVQTVARELGFDKWEMDWDWDRKPVADIPTRRRPVSEPRLDL